MPYCTISHVCLVFEYFFAKGILKSWNSYGPSCIISHIQCVKPQLVHYAIFYWPLQKAVHWTHSWNRYLMCNVLRNWLYNKCMKITFLYWHLAHMQNSTDVLWEISRWSFEISACWVTLNADADSCILHQRLCLSTCYACTCNGTKTQKNYFISILHKCSKTAETMYKFYWLYITLFSTL